ncbi:MAG: helix-turn-helix domain-containing protein [Oscillospiraceae bacterium]|nr:helix-turn-helix domain-containing protein [Oscillospiraceae bacterium]
MAWRMLQNTILQMKEATDRTIGVMNVSGEVVACTEQSLKGTIRESALSSLEEMIGSYMVRDGDTYKPVATPGARFEYVVFVSGEDEYARSLCVMAALAIGNAKKYYDEKHDRATFIKNIILDNILSGDIYMKANELRMPLDVPHIVYLIRQVDQPDNAAVDVVANMFPDKSRDFVVSISESELALISEVSGNYETRDFVKTAEKIRDTLNAEILSKIEIGIGTVAPTLKDLAVSYKEAQSAINIGKMFDTERDVMSYESLGIGRLIYQLPTTVCEMFLSEVFEDSSIDDLDSETLMTIQKFFENNLNVSETSRNLFVHRNTLVYRLEKIKKITGLDLREFDHAIIFKVALMVKRYLSIQGSAF